MPGPLKCRILGSQENPHRAGKDQAKSGSLIYLKVLVSLTSLQLLGL
jgi:hypothetical protein